MLQNDIRLLGISEIILGLIALYIIGYGLLFWTLGFCHPAHTITVATCTSNTQCEKAAPGF